MGRTFKAKTAGMAASVMLLASGVGLASAPPAQATVSPTITSYSTYDATVSDGTFVGSAYQPNDLFHDGTYAWITGDGTTTTDSRLIQMDSSGATVALTVSASTGCTACSGKSEVTGLVADATHVWFGTMWGFVGKVAKASFSSSSTITWIDAGSGSPGMVLGIGPGGKIWKTNTDTGSQSVGVIDPSTNTFTNTSVASRCPSNQILLATSFVTLGSRLYALSRQCDAIVELNPTTGAPVNTWLLSATVAGTVRRIFPQYGTLTVARNPADSKDVLWFSAATIVGDSGSGFVGWLDPDTAPPADAMVTPTATGSRLSAASGPSPTGITKGSDGNLWTVDTAASSLLWRVTTSGVVTEYASDAKYPTTIGAAAVGSSGETILWYNSRGGSASTSNIALYGARKFVLPATFTVSYDANTGSGTAPSATDFAPPATATVASQGSLTKSGYVFTGWNTQAGGGGTAYAAGATYSTAASATLYAQWAVGKTLTYDANGGQGTPPSAAAVVTGGSLTVLGNTNSMTKSGSTFGGWNTLANGTGTDYAAGASITMGADQTLYAVWTPVPPAPPTPSNPTSDTPSSTPTPSPTPSTPTSGTPSDPPLAPVVNSTTKSLPPGKGVVTQGGAVVDVTVAANSSKTGYEFDGDDWKLNLAGTLPGGNSAPLNSRGQLEIVQGRGLRTAGTGFAANTTAEVYLLPPADGPRGAVRSKQSVRDSVAVPLTAPLLLGPVQVGADGTFVDTLPVPLTVAPGDYISQVVGYSPSMQVRTASLGVVLAADKKAVVKRVSTKVYFASGSPVLDAKAKASLSAAAKKIPKGATKINVQSIGYVQGTSYTGNDLKLSTARAVNAAAHLKRDGVLGKSYVSGRGVAKESGATARRVEVVIAYTVSN
jgi:uncharacterized repeat protein (TIGR02543 family)